MESSKNRNCLDVVSEASQGVPSHGHSRITSRLSHSVLQDGFKLVKNIFSQANRSTTQEVSSRGFAIAAVAQDFPDSVCEPCAGTKATTNHDVAACDFMVHIVQEATIDPSAYSTKLRAFTRFTRNVVADKRSKRHASGAVEEGLRKDQTPFFSFSQLATKHSFKHTDLIAKELGRNTSQTLLPPCLA